MAQSKFKDNLANFLKVLSDTTRLEILETLADGIERSAGEIENLTGKSQSSTSQQLKTLINAKLLDVRKDGRNKLYQIRDAQIFKILSALNGFLSSINSDRIDELAEIDIDDVLF